MYDTCASLPCSVPLLPAAAWSFGTDGYLTCKGPQTGQLWINFWCFGFFGAVSAYYELWYSTTVLLVTVTCHFLIQLSWTLGSMSYWWQTKINLCQTHRASQSIRRHSATAWPRHISSSDELTHLKSTFQGFATALPETQTPDPHLIPNWMKNEVVPRLLDHLRISEPRTRRASHDMYAWRVRPNPPSPKPVPFAITFGSSNGGEAGAGERLERLLEVGNCENVVLVVFRWYGGVKLGSDRWKCISTVAKEALDHAGFLGSSSARPSMGAGDGSRGKEGKGRKRRK